MTLDLDTLMRQMTEQKAKDALLTARSTLERSLRELDPVSYTHLTLPTIYSV